MKNIIFLAIIITLLPGCSDFLDREPLSNPTDNSFWKTEQEAEQGVNALYTTISYNGHDDFWRDCHSDNSFMTNPWGSQGLGYICTGAYDASTGYLKEEWRYDYIERILACLTAMKPMEFDEKKKVRLEAEARFFLALKYFRMTRLFGDIPLIKETPNELAESSVPASPKQEVLDYAIENVNFAIQHLPAKYTGADIGRATLGAALMLKAEMYLDMASWKKFHQNQDDPQLWKTAAEAAQQLVDSAVIKNHYGLEGDFAFIFTHEANNNNKEVIFANQYMEGNRTHSLPVLCSPAGTGITGEGWASFCPTRELIDSYKCSDGKTIYDSPGYDMNNPWVNRDLRLAKTFMLPGMPVLRPNNTYTPYMPHPDYMMPERINNEGGGISGYMYLKYNEPTLATPDKAWTNFAIYRYAETLLFLAEALNEYDPGNARIAWAVNQVRSRAGLPAVTATGQDAMRQMIRDERRHEFPAEHKRYFDILRWKIAEDVLNKPAYGINKDKNAPIGDYNAEKFFLRDRKFDPAKNYTWPIPQEALDKNKNLKQSAPWR